MTEDGEVDLTDEEVREYAERLLRKPNEYEVYSWDYIAECHPSGQILTLSSCERVRERLFAATLEVSWDD